MAEGIRVRHTTLRPPVGHATMIVAVRDITEHRDYKAQGFMPPPCSQCGIPSPGHEGYKTRHIEIDKDGYGLVSAGVWEGLRHLNDAGGFELVNTITNPPRKSINFNANGREALVVVHHRPQRPILTTSEKE